MFRAVAILSALLACALLAAPAPATRPLFGAGGVVTPADLEPIAFQTREKDGKKDARDPRADALGVALHMPRNRFRPGEPIPAYFLVRNYSREPVGLDLRLDLFARPLELRNSCKVRLVRSDTGMEVPYVGRGVWACGGPSPVVIPGRGHYCVRGDLAEGETRPLSAGEYECSWSYTGLWSRPVRFTVLPGKEKGREGSPASGEIRFLEIVPPRGESAEAPAGARLIPHSAGKVAAALAVGVTGSHYPDIRDLPGRDDRIAASAEWLSDGKGERLRVTLRPARSGKVVHLSTLR